MKRIILALFALTVFGATARDLKTDMGIRQQDDATMKWWRDAKFGMFIHWGLYAVPAKGEWYMENGIIGSRQVKWLDAEIGGSIMFTK